MKSAIADERGESDAAEIGGDGTGARDDGVGARDDGRARGRRRARAQVARRMATTRIAPGRRPRWSSRDCQPSSRDAVDGDSVKSSGVVGKLDDPRAGAGV